MNTSKIERIKAMLKKHIELANSATSAPWKVGYDGPSRPIIMPPVKHGMLSLSELRNASHVSYEKEDADCEFICSARNLSAKMAVALLLSIERLEKVTGYSAVETQASIAEIEALFPEI